MTGATRMQYKAIANSKTSNKTISIQIDTTYIVESLQMLY